MRPVMIPSSTKSSLQDPRQVFRIEFAATRFGEDVRFAVAEELAASVAALAFLPRHHLLGFRPNQRVIQLRQ
jgi:hypothetical protein